MIKVFFKRFVWLTTVFILGISCANADTSLEWGKDYIPTQTPVPATRGQEIEVQEFFWYGCPHCYHLEPELTQWLKSLPKDVIFKRTPAVLNDSWERLAKIYFAEKHMGLTEQLHGRVFDAIFKDHLNLQDRQAMTQWLQEQGFDSVRFMHIYDSFTVSNDIRRARTIEESAGITEVPTIVVDGRYMTSPSMTGDYAHLFGVINGLIEQARTERAEKTGQHIQAHK